MSWRGSTSIKDRILSSLPYILPLIEVYALGVFLYQDFPILRTLYLPLYPVMAIYGYLSLLIPYFGLVVFLALYLLIVRNERFAHFLRFNTMQALMLGIFSSLCQAILELLGLLRIPNVYDLLVSPFVPNIAAPFILKIVIDAVFLAVVVGSLYSIVQAVRGLYAEIPVISEGAYAQTR